MSNQEIIEAVVARWSDPTRRPLFKGSLIDDTPPEGPCYCAQGDLLRHEGGWSDDDLRNAEQTKADAVVAELLGISRAHSVLLRLINDRADGCPQDVLRAPEKVLGDQAQLVLTFWRRFDDMTPGDWAAAGDAARAAAWGAAVAAALATREIQGAALMRERGQPFFFLRMFGIVDPEELREGGA